MNLTAPTSPAPSLRRRLESIALFALLLVLIVLLFDWNWFKGPLERRVSAVTGREFAIDGDLHVDLGRRLVVRADRVRLGNAEWSSAPQMARSEQIELQFEWRPLFGGRFVLPAVRAKHLELLLERNAKGEANWVFTDSRLSMPEIGALDLSDGKLVVHDAMQRTDLEVAIRSGTPAPGEPPPLLMTGDGTYRGYPFALEGRVESPLALADTRLPYHIDLRMRAADTIAHARGELITPLQISGYDLLFSIAGPNLARLYPLMGLALPDTPPYALDGHLRHEGKVWYFRDFRGKVGDSDLAGDSEIDLNGPRPRLVADLASKNLDLDDLAGFVGAPPSAGPGETASPEQQRAAAIKHAQPKILPDTRYDLVKLRAMDADVKLRAKHVNAPPLPLEDMTAHLMLEDGLMRLDPLAFGIAGGRAGGRIELNARLDPIAASTRIQARGLALPNLFPHALLAHGSAGLIGGSVTLAGRGNSIAAILAHADGDVGVMMGEGRISNLLMELAGIDVAESLRFMIGKDRIIPIRCAYAEFDLADGTMTAQSMVFDTTDTVIYGDGSANLDDETLDLRLRANPKDFSPLAFRSPLKLTGTFKDPHFGPEKGAITVRAVAGVLLHAVAPPAVLLALFDKGHGKDADCSVEPRLAMKSR